VRRRFTWTSTSSRIALGRAAFLYKPYAAPRGETEAAYKKMAKYLTIELKAVPPPPQATVAEKYRELLKASHQEDAKEVRGSGTAEDFDTFKQVWADVHRDVLHWEEQERLHPSEAEKKKHQRLENAVLGSQISDAIMLSVGQRHDPAVPAESALDASNQVDEQLDEEFENSSHALAAGVMPPAAAAAAALVGDRGQIPPFTFTRKRDLDTKSYSSRSAKSQKTDLLASYIKEDQEVRAAQLAELKQSREAEMQQREREHEDHIKLRQQELEIERKRAENEARFLEIRVKEADTAAASQALMQQLLLQLAAKKTDG
jgi:hypothetical protein